MSTGTKFASLVMVGLLCVSAMAGETARTQRKTKKPVLPPPLPSGPQGPVPQIPLDSIPAVAPQVIYQSGQLTILAPNSTLGDILRAIRKQTAAEIDIPANANERVVTSLGPGSAREVVAELLNGSRFNYVLLGSPSDASLLTRVVLVAKTGPEVVGGPSQPQDQQPVIGQAGNPMPPPQAAVNPAELQDAEATDDSAMDDNADQTPAEAEQQQGVPQEQQPGGIKTPQQMLQEMQQRQLQMQQQMAPGQPPIPGAALPQPQPHPQPQPQPQEP
jgi:hypothetical protein